MKVSILLARLPVDLLTLQRAKWGVHFFSFPRISGRYHELVYWAGCNRRTSLQGVASLPQGPQHKRIAKGYRATDHHITVGFPQVID